MAMVECLKIDGPVRYNMQTHLKIQFRSNAKEEIQVEVIVMCDERLGSGTTRYHIHHWCFNLQKPLTVKKSPNERNDVGTHDEVVTNSTINNKVKIALAIASLLVGNAEMLMRKHMKTRCKKFDMLGNNAKFTPLCTCCERRKRITRLKITWFLDKTAIQSFGRKFMARYLLG